MVRKKYKIILICLAIILSIALSIGVIYAKINPETLTKTIMGNDYQNHLVYDSSLYTGLDDESINTSKGSLNENDKRICTSNNQAYELYFNASLCIFKVKNTKTGYVYASAMDTIDDTASTNYYGGFLSSTFSIEYYNYNIIKNEYDLNVMKAWITKATKLSAGEKNEIQEQNPEITKFNFSLGIAPATTYTYEYLENGVKVNLVFANATTLKTDKSYSLEIGFSAYVTLDDEGLHVRIPNDEIIENGTARLANILVMPMMGATYNNEVPGYMVIPDGSGALVRYGYVQKQNAKQQKLSYYKDNIAQVIQGVSNDYLSSDKTLNLPIFGYINGVNQDGVYGIIEEGSRLASLIVSPCGALNMNYNYMIPSFTKRYRYLLYGVNSTLTDELYNENIQIAYHFLENDSANYVGIANDYQKYLLDTNQLIKTSDGTYKTQIDFLLSETVEGAFGNKKITMTSLEAVNNMYDELKSLGLEDMIVVLKGWNKAGYSGSTPYKVKLNTKLGSKRDFTHLVNKLKEDQTNLYLYNDYIIGYSHGNTSKSDVARNDLRLRMNFTDTYKVLYQDYFYLYPLSSKEKLEKDSKKYQKLNITGLALDTIGDTLYSYYANNTIASRNDSYHIYQEALDQLASYKLAMYHPNAYMYKYLNDYLEMPMYTNNYVIYSDTIPLVPYVLKGYVDYYSEYVNFNAIGVDQYLRMIDYGCFPSYILTKEISYNLKYTNSVDLYTTAYHDWKDDIVFFDQTYKPAYLATTNAKVVKREVLKIGVVKVTYQNIDTHKETALLINYNQESTMVDTIKVDGKSFVVIGENHG